MKRKIALVFLAVALVAIIAVGGSLAYFYAETDEATNTFTFGSVTGELTENGEDGPDWDDGDSADGVLPGQTVPKAPVVTNGEGSADAFVRLIVSGVDAEYCEIVGLNVGTEPNQWTAGENGVYYYNKKIAAEEATTPLFTGIKIAAGVEQPLEIADFEISVVGELLQADYLVDDSG
ncbi:MAG: SipW-dependent-type signal peptide-containing protein, partial [Clostridiales bacterium]|nr:SipW-dependent-type signal peptide-containing protein [Clostridiales bacterium]